MAKAPKQQAQKRGKGIWGPLILGVVVSLTFWVPHLDSFNISKFVALGLGVLILSALALPNLKVTSQAKAGSYLLLIFVIMLVVNLFTSPNTYKSLIGALGRNNGVLTYFFFAVLAFLISIHFKLTDLPKLLWALAGLGIFQTFYNILQLVDADPITWNNPYGFILGTLGNSDFAAALLAICSIATLWLARMYAGSKKISFGLMALVAIQFVVMFQSNVRQSLVLFFFGIAVLVYSELASKRKPISLVWGGLVSIAGFLALLGTLQIGPLTKFLFKESITYRGDYWRAAWRMFSENPAFGVGLGNYGDYFNRYRDAAQVARRGPAVGSDVAHSMPLDFLAMGGITLGLAYLALIVYSVFLVIAKIRSLEGINKQQGYIVFSLLGAYLLQSLISIDQIGLAVWGWIFIGVALSFARERKLIAALDPHLAKLFVPVAVLVTAISFVMVSVPTWRADAALKQLASVPAEQQGVDTRSIRLQIASDIEKMTPRDSQFKTQIALYLLSNGQAEGIDYAKKALEQNPSDSSALRYLIIAYGQLNDPTNQEKYKAEALKIDPFNPDLK
jgi:putative inorganic carbon (HCO3(-)) transporter